MGNCNVSGSNDTWADQLAQPGCPGVLRCFDVWGGGGVGLRQNAHFSISVDGQLSHNNEALNLMQFP